LIQDRSRLVDRLVVAAETAATCGSRRYVGKDHVSVLINGDLHASLASRQGDDDPDDAPETDRHDGQDEMEQMVLSTCPSRALPCSARSF